MLNFWMLTLLGSQYVWSQRSYALRKKTTIHQITMHLVDSGFLRSDASAKVNTISPFRPFTRRAFTWYFGSLPGNLSSVTSTAGGGVSYDRRQICTCSSPCLAAVSALFRPCRAPYIPSKGEVVSKLIVP